MSITLRTNKATALTYNEMDKNLSQYYYSSSVDNNTTEIRLYLTGSTSLGAGFEPRYDTITGYQILGPGDSAQTVKPTFGTFTVTGIGSNVLGGALNNVIGSCSSIVGGSNNTISGSFGFIGGGNNNIVSSSCGVVIGGRNNCATNVFGTVVGGESNNAQGEYSYIGNGFNNIICGDVSTIIGGQCNTILDQYSTIAGGRDNCITHKCSVIVGGQSNTITEHWSTVGGGTTNTIETRYATIGGGATNCINSSGTYGGILAGQNNLVAHGSSFIIGTNIGTKANCTTYVNNLHVTGSTTTNAILELSRRETTPSPATEGMIIASGSAGSSKLYYYDGSTWNALF